MRHLTAAGLAGLAGWLLVPAAVPAAAADEPGEECSSINSTRSDGSDGVEDTGPSEPIAGLQIGDTHRLLRDHGRPLGLGATVAVVDSGVSGRSGLPVAARVGGFSSTSGEDQRYYQATAAAGLIVGPARGETTIGIAPQARLLDVPVYDVPSAGDSDDGTPLKTANLVAGLQALAHTSPLPTVVSVSLTVGPDRALERAVHALTDRGVVVVASAGDRQPSASGSEETPAPDDDAAHEAYPAGYALEDPLVVAVSSTVDSGEPSAVLLPNSAITVVAPSADAVSYAVDGRTCHLTAPSAAMATAEVSGVLALLKSARPDDSGSELVARLVQSAAGSDAGPAGGRGTALGYGVVQPYEALTRMVAPGGPGGRAAGSTPVAPARVDAPDPDLLAGVRRNAVWWGLGAGGVLAVALLLRPVLGRRRSG